MKNAFYMDEHGTQHIFQLPDDATDITQSVTLSQTVKILQDQHEEQCKHNKRLYRISVATTIIAALSFLASAIAVVTSLISCT